MIVVLLLECKNVVSFCEETIIYRLFLYFSKYLCVVVILCSKFKTNKMILRKAIITIIVFIFISIVDLSSDVSNTIISNIKRTRTSSFEYRINLNILFLSARRALLCFLFSSSSSSNICEIYPLCPFS